MKKLFFICIFNACLCNSLFANKNLAYKIDQLVKKSKVGYANLGLAIHPLSKKKSPIYDLNANNYFTPASLVKIGSAVAFYHFFNPQYQFITKLLIHGTQSQSQLKGDLIIKGGGDPGFTSESLWSLVNNFSRTGIKTITGNLLVDDSLYKKAPFRLKTQRSYETLVSAASFNWNSVTFHIRPNKQINQPAIIFINPDNTYIKTINKVKTHDNKTKLSINRVSVKNGREVFKISGYISKDKKEITKYRNITRPYLWLGHNVYGFLKEKGIKIEGKIKKGKCPNTCTVVSEFSSRPLSWQIYNFMTYSNNFIGRMLTTHLPLTLGEHKGSYKTGVKLIKNHLKKLNLGAFKLREPVGLSKHNQLTPNQIQAIMLSQTKNFNNIYLLASYPVIGGEGTLKNKYTLLKGKKIRAKTGSLNKVLGLAGMFENSKNQSYLFTFIYNGPNKKILSAEKLFQQILWLLTS